MSNTVQSIDVATLQQWIMDDDVILIDVRETSEYAQASIPGSRHLPLSGLHLADLPDRDGRKVVVSCATGRRSMMAAEGRLAAHYGGVYNLDGGLSAWQLAGYDITRDDSAASETPGLFSFFGR
ncbi:MAG: rhodanese-like domain-containing protein [Alphaproteobacteria bacterium]